MTTETKTRTLEEIIDGAKWAATKAVSTDGKQWTLEQYVREAFAAGAASRASPEEGRLRAALEADIRECGTDDCERCEWLRGLLAKAALRSPPAPTETPLTSFDRRCADYLAAEVYVLIKRNVIDSRSPAGDALNDYLNGRLPDDLLTRAELHPRPRPAPPTEDEGAREAGHPMSTQGEGPCLCDHAENLRKAHADDCPAKKVRAPASSKEGER